MSLRRSSFALLATGVAAALATVPFGTSATAAPLAATSTGAATSAGAAKATAATGGGHGRLKPRHSLRSSVTNQNFYFVMADRFANGSTANDTGGIVPVDHPDQPQLDTGFDPTNKGFYNGGDLIGLRSKLDYIQGLGTNAIWLTPSFKNKAVQLEDGPSAGYHGYWVTDFTQIDPHLGTNADLKALVDDAHSRGMKVYFDIITNHTADVIGYQEGARTAYVSKDASPYKDASGKPFDDRDYAGTNTFPTLDPNTSFPYKPVLDPGEEHLKVPDWLNDVTLYHNRGNTTFTGEDALYGDFFGLDDLFTENPKVVNGMIDVYETWISEMGIDGFRIDTMKHVDDAFWEKFGPTVLKYAHDHGKKDFFMFGEVFDTQNIAFTSEFSTRDKMQATLDFPFQDAARNFASKGLPATGLRTLFRADDWYTDADSNAYQKPTFLGNHDMGRIGYFVTADNPGATESELVKRDKLAHALMYFSRGNPVVYYGDEQGFTGTGGDQLARQTLFASKVPEYQDPVTNNMLGSDRTPAVDNFETGSTLYRDIEQLAAITKAHPTLRNGAQQDRYADTTAGVYAFSRYDRKDRHEYVVALNNATTPKTASIPTYIAGGAFTRIVGSGSQLTSTAGGSGGHLTTSAGRRLTIQVPPLSAVVYRSDRKVPASTAAPWITLNQPVASAEINSRELVNATVGGKGFNEVTFYASVNGGPWKSLGTDDNRPYRVYQDTTSLAPGTTIRYRAVVLDNAGHKRLSEIRTAKVPLPAVSFTSPAEGANVFGTVTVSATADPELATHVVDIQQSLDGGPWQTLTTDDSSPVYSYTYSLDSIPEGTQIRYRAVLHDPHGVTSVSPIRTVTRTAYQPLVPSVTVAGNVQSEIGCPGDWDPACDVSDLTFDSTDGVWKGTWHIPAPDDEGNHYEWKVAVNNSWDVNYGAGGASGGSNLSLTIPAGGADVTFMWDQASHIPSAVVH